MKYSVYFFLPGYLKAQIMTIVMLVAIMTQRAQYPLIKEYTLNH